jgi:hypothetical protein
LPGGFDGFEEGCTRTESRFVQFPMLLFISHHVLSPISIESR